VLTGFGVWAVAHWLMKATTNSKSKASPRHDDRNLFLPPSQNRFPFSLIMTSYIEDEMPEGGDGASFEVEVEEGIVGPNECDNDAKKIDGATSGKTIQTHPHILLLRGYCPSCQNYIT
jgi:hypothetical protein